MDSERKDAVEGLKPCLLGMLNIMDSEPYRPCLPMCHCLLGMLNIMDSERG